jgi:hypothetical protein
MVGKWHLGPADTKYWPQNRGFDHFYGNLVGEVDFSPRRQAAVTGCVSNYSWCGVAIGGVTGWASAEYLVTDAGGKLTNLQLSGAQLGIPVVVPEGVSAVVATPPVGAMVAVPPTVGVVEPIPPARRRSIPSRSRLTCFRTSTVKGFWSSRGARRIVYVIR